VGGVQVLLEDSYHRRQPAGATVTITDSGAGILENHLNKIFKPFFTTKGELGTGLGLWVAGASSKAWGRHRAHEQHRSRASGSIRGGVYLSFAGAGFGNGSATNHRGPPPRYGRLARKRRRT